MYTNVEYGKEFEEYFLLEKVTQHPRSLVKHVKLEACMQIVKIVPARIKVEPLCCGPWPVAYKPL